MNMSMKKIISFLAWAKIPVKALKLKEKEKNYKILQKIMIALIEENIL